MEIQIISPQGSESTRFKKFFDDDIVIPKNSKIYLNHAILNKSQGITLTTEQTLNFNFLQNEVYGNLGADTLKLSITFSEGDYTYNGLRELLKTKISAMLTDAGVRFVGYESFTEDDPDDGREYFGIQPVDSGWYLDDELYASSIITLNTQHAEPDTRIVSQSTPSQLDFESFFMLKDPYFHGSQLTDWGRRGQSDLIKDIPYAKFELTKGNDDLTLYDIIEEAGQPKIAFGFYGAQYAEDNSVGTEGARTNSLAIVEVPSSGGVTPGSVSRITLDEPKIVTFDTIQTIAGGTIAKAPETVTLSAGGTGAGLTATISIPVGEAMAVSLTDTGGNPSPATFNDGENYTATQSDGVFITGVVTAVGGEITGLTVTGSMGDVVFGTGVVLTGDTSGGVFHTYCSIGIGGIDIITVTDGGNDYILNETVQITGDVSGSVQNGVVSQVGNGTTLPTMFFACLLTRDLDPTGNDTVFMSFYICENVAGTEGTPVGWSNQAFIIDQMKLLQTFDLGASGIFEENEPLEFSMRTYIDVKQQGWDDTPSVYVAVHSHSHEGTTQIFDSQDYREYFGYDFFNGLGSDTDVFKESQRPFQPCFTTNTENYGSQITGTTELTDDTSIIIRDYSLDATTELAKILGFYSATGDNVSHPFYPNINSPSAWTNQYAPTADFLDFYKLQSYVVKINNLPIQSYKTTDTKGNRGYKQSILSVIPTPFQNANDTREITIGGNNFLSVTYNSFYPMVKEMNNQKMVVNHFDVEISRLSDDQLATDLDQVAINFTILPGESE